MDRAFRTLKLHLKLLDGAHMPNNMMSNMCGYYAPSAAGQPPAVVIPRIEPVFNQAVISNSMCITKFAELKADTVWWTSLIFHIKSRSTTPA